MFSSRFCFAFAGDTCIAQRFYNAIAYGCIPVVSCDVAGAFKHNIPYSSMMIRVSVRHNMSQIMSMLRAIPLSKVYYIQNLLRRYAPLLRYDQEAPSQILEEVIRIDPLMHIQF